jgi:hypothetical protein
VLSILVVTLTLGLLYGFIVVIDWAMQRWFSSTPTWSSDVVAANAIVGAMEIDFAVSGTGIGSAIAAEMPVEIAAIGETVGPMSKPAKNSLAMGRQRSVTCSAGYKI